METKLEQIAAKAVKQRPKSVVREIRTPRSVGTGGGRPPPVTRWRPETDVPTANGFRTLTATGANGEDAPIPDLRRNCDRTTGSGLGNRRTVMTQTNEWPGSIVQPDRSRQHAGPLSPGGPSGGSIRPTGIRNLVEMVDPGSVAAGNLGLLLFGTVA